MWSKLSASNLNPRPSLFFGSTISIINYTHIRNFLSLFRDIKLFDTLHPSYVSTQKRPRYSLF